MMGAHTKLMGRTVALQDMSRIPLGVVAKGSMGLKGRAALGMLRHEQNYENRMQQHG